MGNFNPLPPHGGRPGTWRNAAYRKRFQSTPSAWRETSETKALQKEAIISIHSLRMEGDAYSEEGFCHLSISIHSLRMEGDPTGSWRESITLPFQSTPSAWRETAKRNGGMVDGIISIHSLRMEGDCFLSGVPSRNNISIHSLRMEGDRSACEHDCTSYHISIHSLRMEGDLFTAHFPI